MSVSTIAIQRRVSVPMARWAKVAELAALVVFRARTQAPTRQTAAIRPAVVVLPGNAQVDTISHAL